MKDPKTNAEPHIRVIRSKKRRKTVSARWVGDTIEIRAPEDIAERELKAIVEKLQTRLDEKRTRQRLNEKGDLRERAEELNRRYFDGKLSLESIRYVTNQNHRFGSCTPARKTIRISHRLAKYPTWVLDYVIVHELAHLVHENHSKAFWRLVSRYPLTERARGFLIAVGLAKDDVQAADASGEEDVELPS